MHSEGDNSGNKAPGENDQNKADPPATESTSESSDRGVKRAEDVNNTEAVIDSCTSKSGIDSQESSADEPQFKKQRGESRNGEFCALCLLGPADGLKLQVSHQCSQCKPSAWRICEPCENNILSGSCPICHGDYGAVEFHRTLQTSDFHSEEYAAQVLPLLSKIKIQIIAASNIAIWIPSTRSFQFSLPVDTTVPKHEIKYCIATIPETDDAKMVGDKFHFTNKIWDALEKSEQGHGASEVFSVREMFASVLSTLSDTNNVLLTSLCLDDQLELLESTLSAVKSSNLDSNL
jgi:hypothetical protein